MTQVPEFYGIRRSNVSMQTLWSKNYFPRSLSVALVNYFGDRATPINYIKVNNGNRSCVTEIPVGDLYRCPVSGLSDVSFDFDSVYEPFTELADGVPESDLVIRDPRGLPLSHLEVLTSVIPDSSTKGQPDDLMGPEVTVRTNLLQACALSMASSLYGEGDAIDILELGIPQDMDWSDLDEVWPYVDRMVENLDAMESRFTDRQSPFLLQSVWKSERDGPFMADDAMDAFAWSDFAFTRLFLDPTGRSSESRQRPLRAAVRLYRMLTLMLRGEHPDLGEVVEETSYGSSDSRELMVAGRAVNRYMACDRLTRPKASRLDVSFLGTTGFESMIEPERRLDVSVYQAVRSIRR